MIRSAVQGVLVVLLAAAPVIAQGTRIVRVVDSSTAKPLELAEVILAGRATMRTSDSGLVSLRSLKPGPTRLTVRRVGYESKPITFDASETDTAVIKVSLVQIARSLPSVNTEAVHDSKLEMMGFYQRQKSSAAPRSAFITAADIERWKPTLLTDVKYRTGRNIAACLKYIDGVQVGAASTRGNTYRQGIDALVQPSDVAAMEVYRLSEAPPQYAPTLPRPVPCVLLIWLK